MISLHNLLQFCMVKTMRDIVVIEAVELKSNSGAIMHYNAVHLFRKRNDISVIDSLVLSNAAQCLSWYAGKKAPVLLIANGDKVLHRNVAEHEDADIEVVLKKWLPGIAPADFYCQFYTYAQGVSFVSVVRKTYLQQVTDELSGLNSKMIYAAVGPFLFLPAAMAFSPADMQHFELAFMNYNFSFDDNGFAGYKIAPYRQPEALVSLCAGSETLSEALVIVYSYGLCFFLNPLAIAHIDMPGTKEVRDNVVFTAISKPFIAAMTIVLFAVLLCSSAVFATYSRKYNDLQAQVAEKQQRYELHQQQQQQKEEQLSVLLKNGLNHKSRVAFYADQVSSLLPGEIYLSKLMVHPAFNSDGYLFDNTKIIVSGNCYSGNDLNAWLGHLRGLNWVKSVIVKEFKLMEADVLGSFSIEIIKKQNRWND